jgi:hypothetical protein
MHAYEIESWGNGAPALQIDLPDGYEIQRKQGADFDVHYISPATANDGPVDARMGIYIGHYPSFSEPTGDTIAKVANVGNQMVKWVCWDTTQEGKKVYRCETLVSGFYDHIRVTDSRGEGVSRLVLHLFIAGIDADKVNLLRETTETLRFKQ